MSRLSEQDGATEHLEQERRIAEDGWPYTKKEFWDYYNSNEAWERADASSAWPEYHASASNSGPAALPTAPASATEHAGPEQPVQASKLQKKKKAIRQNPDNLLPGKGPGEARAWCLRHNEEVARLHTELRQLQQSQGTSNEGWICILARLGEVERTANTLKDAKDVVSNIWRKVNVRIKDLDKSQQQLCERMEVSFDDCQDDFTTMKKRVYA